MANQKQAENDRLDTEQPSQELSADELDQVSGGIIINGRVQPPPEPDRTASSLLGDLVTKISPPPEPD
jgi:hypothetical protein